MDNVAILQRKINELTNMYNASQKENYELKKKLKIKEKTAGQAMSSNTSLFHEKQNINNTVSGFKTAISQAITEMTINTRNKRVSLNIAKASGNLNKTIQLESEIKTLESAITLLNYKIKSHVK